MLAVARSTSYSSVVYLIYSVATFLAETLGLEHNYDQIHRTD